VHAAICAALTLSAISASAAQQQLRCTQQLQTLLQQYMQVRADALQATTQLLERVEDGLGWEERRQLSDRCEVNLIRVTNSFNPSQPL